VRAVGLLALALLAACTAARIESTHFSSSGAIERAIMRHYERHASEDGGRCLRPYIDGFTEITVLEDTPDQLIVHARYFYRDRVQEGGEDRGGMVCTGFEGRTFTVAPGPDGRPVVVEMTGEEEEGLIRSLIRRALPD